MKIRAAVPRDRNAIRQLHLQAFDESENSMVAALAVNLLDEETTPPTLAFVADIDAIVAGHVAFSPVTAESDHSFTGYILAPLGVSPAHQGVGVGSRLTEHGIEQIANTGVDLLFVYGDPKYYGRFGFSAATAEPYLPPYSLEYPFGWQALALDAKDPPGSPIPIACVASLSDPELW